MLALPSSQGFGLCESHRHVWIRLRCLGIDWQTKSLNARTFDSVSEIRTTNNVQCNHMNERIARCSDFKKFRNTLCNSFTEIRWETKEHANCSRTTMQLIFSVESSRKRVCIMRISILSGKLLKEDFCTCIQMSDEAICFWRSNQARDLSRNLILIRAVLTLLL